MCMMTSSMWTLFKESETQVAIAEKVIKHLHEDEDFRYLWRMRGGQKQKRHCGLAYNEGSWKEIQSYYNMASISLNEDNKWDLLTKVSHSSWFPMFNTDKDIQQIIPHKKYS
jgi:hypothetical protein